jgi:hypothetical protein
MTRTRRTGAPTAGALALVFALTGCISGAPAVRRRIRRRLDRIAGAGVRRLRLSRARKHPFD